MLGGRHVAQTDTALRQVRAALNQVDAFVAKYMKRPFGDTVNASAVPESWLDQVYHDPDRKAAPLPHTIVEHMEKVRQVYLRGVPAAGVPRGVNHRGSRLRC